MATIKVQGKYTQRQEGAGPGMGKSGGSMTNAEGQEEGKFQAC